MIERGYPKLTIQLCKRFNHVHTVEAVIIPNLRSLIRSFNFEHYIFEAESQRFSESVPCLDYARKTLENCSLECQRLLPLIN